MAVEARVSVSSNVTTEKQAAETVSDFIRNPPKNPVDVVRFVAKNFSASGDVVGGLVRAVPALSSISKVLPIASAIFDAFTSITAPSIGDQIASAVSEISSKIEEATKEVKNAIESGTAQTISAILGELETVSLQESALRTIQAMRESDLLAEADRVTAQILADYAKDLDALNESWSSEILEAIAAANAEIDAAYAKVQEILAGIGIDLLSQLYSVYQSATVPRVVNADAAAISPGIQERQEKSVVKPDNSALLIGGISLAAIFLFMNKKK